ncbi:MAG: hypothetical protein WA549_06005 [Thermoplasmata archaeon]
MSNDVCTNPVYEYILWYVIIPETAVLLIAVYGLLGWLKTRKIFGFGQINNNTKEHKEETPESHGYISPPKFE